MMVDNRSSVLRFNIAEKVRLVEQAASIHALEEIELIPEVEVNIRGEHAVLKGYLLLTGAYSGIVDRQRRQGSSTMEHRIPVEITLPVSRISREDNILVEIENFDVDVLDPRTIFVTGSLTLSGVNTSNPAADTADHEEGSDEMVFVDTADADDMDGSDERVTVAVGTNSDEEVAEGREQELPSTSFAVEGSATTDVDVSGGEAVSAAAARSETAGADDAVEADGPSGAVAGASHPSGGAAGASRSARALAAEASASTEDTVGATAAADGAPQEASPAQGAVEAAEPKPAQLRVAFGSKKGGGEDAPINLASALSRRASVPGGDDDGGDAEAAEEPAEAAVDPQDARGGGFLDWARMLRRGEELPNRSTKVRIGLVQSDDTLDRLSERFGVNPKELALLNRLAPDEELRAGQVLYLPDTAPKQDADKRGRKAN